MGLALSLNTDDSPPDAAHLTSAARARWPDVLADVQFARRYRDAQSSRSAGALRETHCSLACLQSAGG